MIKIQVKKMMRTLRGEELLEVGLDFNSGELVTLFGQSGAGKTTVLRLLAGLDQVQEGYIEVDGVVWLDSRKGVNVPVQQRKIGFVFQENCLFPNMTVRGNLEYASVDQSAQGAIDEWLVTLGLKGLGSQRPDQLSGGQKQRVALARALINQPKILLLDEPLSDLDVGARTQLQDEIIKIQQKACITTILVSHDLAEAFKLSKKIFLIDNGRIIKSGSPQEVFVNDDLSGKFKFTAQILEIQKDGVLNIVTLAIGHHITKVVASDEEIAGLTVGAKVIVAAKAFNPLILKV